MPKQKRSRKRQFGFTGSISSGTLRVQDLWVAYMEVLEAHWPAKHKELARAFRRYTRQYNDPSLFGPSRGKNMLYDIDNPPEGHTVWESHDFHFLHEEAFDALAELAPEGYYFGAHYGDGADMGYWPEEELEDEDWLDDDWAMEREFADDWQEGY